MTRWYQASAWTFCGRCDQQIPRGEPVYEFSQWKRLRCRLCAEVPVPDDVPELEMARGFETPLKGAPGITRSPTKDIGMSPLATQAVKFGKSIPWRSASHQERQAKIQMIKATLKDMKLAADGKESA